AFLEQSEKSTGTRIFLILNGEVIAAVMRGSSRRSNSSSTSPGIPVGFAFIVLCLACRIACSFCEYFPYLVNTILSAGKLHVYCQKLPLACGEIPPRSRPPRNGRTGTSFGELNQAS